MKFKPRAKTTRIILHDSHTTPDVVRAQDVLRWQGMKMGLLDIGYHWIVERDGTCIATRPEDQIGTHTPGCNMDSIGVCLVGGRSLVVPNDDRDHRHDYPDDNFTEAQKVGLYDLLLGIKRRYPGIAIVGHSEVQRYRDKGLPPCPMVDMHELRADLLTYAKTGVV
jgi:N-acetyl-anhydromuramyl-L-alanine amidase AmpD